MAWRIAPGLTAGPRGPGLHFEAGNPAFERRSRALRERGGSLCARGRGNWSAAPAGSPCQEMSGTSGMRQGARRGAGGVGACAMVFGREARWTSGSNWPWGRGMATVGSV